MISKLINFAAFQVGWFACVLGAANGMPLLGLLVACAVVLLHLAMAAKLGRELRLVLLAVAMGAVLDSLLVTSGWLRYPNGILVPGTAPYWILAMWGLFATTLNSSMDWLRGRPLVAALLGAVFGPLSYLAGARLGGLTFVDVDAAVPALALAWALAMPLLVGAAGRFDGVTDASAGEALRAVSQGEN